MSTADSRAEEAWTRRRNAREPSDDKSRSSRRSRGLRKGFTFDVEASFGADVLCCVLLGSSWVAGGSAEDCGAGGELDVDVDVGAGDIV